MSNPTSHHDAHEHHAIASSPPPGCPRWCVSQHTVHLGEEDWLHTGEPLMVADGLTARLCMSIHPTTRDEDGPYVLIGTSELTLDETARLSASLLDLANAPMRGSVSAEQPEGALPVLDA